MLNLPLIVVAILALVLFVHVYVEYFLNHAAQIAFIWRFGFTPLFFAENVSFSQWWTLVSYAFLHGNWLHLGLNMIWFVIFGAPLANSIGTLRFVLLWLLTAVLAALTHFVLHYGSPVPMIGASGAVSGIMGAAARYGFRRLPYSQKPAFAGAVLPLADACAERNVVVFVGIWLIGNLAAGLFSFTPGVNGDGSIAWEAHIGGLIAGFFLIGLLDRRRY